MQQIYIPRQRAQLIRSKGEILDRIARACHCKISFASDDYIEINGDAIEEYTAKNVIHAFGAGFGEKEALLLLDDDYYFSSLDLDQIFENRARVAEIMGRLIGVNGKTKRYIESVSSAHVSIYGNVIGIIGKISQVQEADTAIRSLINGSGHKRAYSRMEATHRHHKETQD